MNTERDIERDLAKRAKSEGPASQSNPKRYKSSDGTTWIDFGRGFRREDVLGRKRKLTKKEKKLLKRLRTMIRLAAAAELGGRVKDGTS